MGKSVSVKVRICGIAYIYYAHVYGKLGSLFVDGHVQLSRRDMSCAGCTAGHYPPAAQLHLQYIWASAPLALYRVVGMVAVAPRNVARYALCWCAVIDAMPSTHDADAQCRLQNMTSAYLFRILLLLLQE